MAWTNPSPLPVYNLVPNTGTPATFGTIISLGGESYVIYLVGGIDSATDREYVTVSDLPAGLAIVSETLTLWGAPQEQNACSTNNPFGLATPPPTTLHGVTNCGATDLPFITNASDCSDPLQAATISADAYVDPMAASGNESTAARTPMVGTQYPLPGVQNPNTPINCATDPTATSTLSANPLDAGGNTLGSVATDSPTGLHVGVTFSSDNNPADLAPPSDAGCHRDPPPGFTINPSAAGSVQACSDSQFGMGTTNAIGCPTASQVGTVLISSPAIPDPLKGAVYLGTQQSGDPFRIFIDAKAVDPASGDVIVDIRLEGSIISDPSTGQLTTTLSNLPQLPVSSFDLSFNGGQQAVIASPLDCGTGKATASITPWTGNPAVDASATITTDSNGSGGSCPSPLGFSPTTGVTLGTSQAGASSSLSVLFTRSAQQQYLSTIKVVLPPGLTGLISSVPLCSSSAAALGTCPASSQVGTATVKAGAGSTPLAVTGTVYLAGPYTPQGGPTYPFSLSIVVPVSAGPFNLGTQVVQAGIGVDPTDAHLTTVSTLPTMQSFELGSIPPAPCPSPGGSCQGLLLRIQSVNLTLNRPGFILNGTNCAAHSGSSTVGGIDPAAGTTASTTSALSVAAFTGCSTLPFAPTLTITAPAASASTLGTTGAGLDVKLTQPPGQSNNKTVAIDLPSAFTARLSTVQGACLAATYAAGPGGCPAASEVGTVTATTPLLPGTLTGIAYLVSQGSAGLPNINVVLNDDGVTFDLTVAISFSASGGLVSSLTSPDVPISSFDLDLPPGPHSALAATASLCAGALSAPTTLDAQSGATVTESIPVHVSGCPATVPVIRVSRHSYKKGVLQLTVGAPAAGRLSVSGSGSSLRGWTFKHVTKATTTTIRVPLSHRALDRLRRHHRLKLIVRVGFLPKSNKIPTARTFVTINLRS